MADSRACSGCGFVNVPGAAACAGCGRLFAPSEAALHPGETLRDPDDLALPDSPLLRAVVRGTAEGGVHEPPSPLQRPQPAPRTDVDQTAALRDLAERLQRRTD